MIRPSLSIALRDPRRLASLGATELMDSPAEPSFDRLTRHAAELLRVPTRVDDARRHPQVLGALIGGPARARRSPRPPWPSLTGFSRPIRT
jgi:hypothetical protein